MLAGSCDNRTMLKGRVAGAAKGALLGLAAGVVVGFGVGASWYSELFATRMRYTGASLGFQVGAAIGGLTPFVAATFMAWTGGATWPISIYLIVLAIITFIATIAAPERPEKN